MKEPVTLTDRV